MPTFKQVTPDVYRAIEDLLNRYHGPMKDAGVTFYAQFAYASVSKNGNVGRPPIKNDGHARYSDAKIVPLSDRTAGSTDAKIFLDGDRWGDLTDDQQEAAIDEALEMVALCVDNKGDVITDEESRPKLRKVRPDYSLRGWNAVARRHQADAPNVRDWSAFEGKRKQLWMAFGEGERLDGRKAPVDDKPKKSRKGSKKKAVEAESPVRPVSTAGDKKRIRAIVKKLESGELSMTVEESQACFDAGALTAKQGLDATDCPYVNNVEERDWVRGWVMTKHGEDLDFGQTSDEHSDELQHAST